MSATALSFPCKVLDCSAQHLMGSSQRFQQTKHMKVSSMQQKVRLIPAAWGHVQLSKHRISRQS